MDLSGSGVSAVTDRQVGAVVSSAAGEAEQSTGGVRFGTAGPDGIVPGGLVVELPPYPDLTGLSPLDAALALDAWEAACGGWAPDAWDIPYELEEEASEAARIWDEVPIDPAFRSRPGEPAADLNELIAQNERLATSPRALASTLASAGFPEHVVRQVCALIPVLTSGAAGASPAVTARPADDAGAMPDVCDRSALKVPRASDQQLIAAAEATVVLQRWCDALLTGVLTDLGAATGDKFLARERVATPAELTVTGRGRWRAKTKSVLANELKALTGWGIQDCHDRVGFALGSRQTTGLPWAALATGDVQWNQVRAWWSTSRKMPVEVAAEVASRTFGPNSDRARSVRDAVSRDAPGGQARESYGETKDTLARLVAALLGEDPATARRQRQAALSRRDASAQIEDDGTGELTVSGRASSVVAALDRVDQIARAVRSAGDGRTLAQLRADIAMSLLVHGSITPATGLPDPPPAGASGAAAPSSSGQEPAAPEDATSPLIGDTSRQADAAVELTGRESPPGDGTADEAGGTSPPDDSTHPSNGAAHPPDRAAHPPDGAAHPPDGAAHPPDGAVSPPVHAQADGGVVGAPDEALAAVLAGRPRVNLEVIVPLEVLLNPRSAAVGMIPGGGYLSAEEIRDLALGAGGVLHRLVTDPLDGRLVERSITGYPFDQRMRDQIIAADQVCRAPGCTVPARMCQLDHVVNYEDGVSGGLTTEANGQPAHGVHHQLKTWDAWKAAMDRHRNVTWKTLFGRVYRTRSFDFRKLARPWDLTGPDEDGPGTSATGVPATQEEATEEQPTQMQATQKQATQEQATQMQSRPRLAADEYRERTWRDVLDGDRDLQDRLIYAALTHREPGAPLAADDDDPDPEYAQCGRAWLHHQAPIQLRHRTRGGRLRRGAPPGQPTPEEILGRRDEAPFHDWEASAGGGGPAEPPPPF